MERVREEKGGLSKMEQVGGGGNGKKTVTICMGPSPVKCIPLLRLEVVLPPKDPSSRDSAHGGPYRHGVAPTHGEGRRYPHGALHSAKLAPFFPRCDYHMGDLGQW